MRCHLDFDQMTADEGMIEYFRFVLTDGDNSQIVTSNHVVHDLKPWIKYYRLIEINVSVVEWPV